MNRSKIQVKVFAHVSKHVLLQSAKDGVFGGVLIGARKWELLSEGSAIERPTNLSMKH